MTNKTLRSGLTQLGVFTGRPVAFVIFGGYAAGWAVVEPETLDMHAGATLVTWLMTLFIQRSSHRDTQALHAKTDEILRALSGARTELSQLDDDEPEEIEEHRERERGRAD